VYPKPGSKHHGKIIFAVGAYRESIILTDDFGELPDSPQKFELVHSIFRHYDLPTGVYEVTCTIWFYSSSNDCYLGKPIGRVIKPKLKTLIALGN
jgi:hypothetical protein